MRKTPNHKIDRFRVEHPELGRSEKGENWGYFEVPFGGIVLRVIASDGIGWTPIWEHVSVSLPDRCPTWDEMCKIKDLFWSLDETVIQFHPPKTKYVNVHPFCLHLWRQVGRDPELPPLVMV